MQIAILAEKPDSLAARILPLLDQGIAEPGSFDVEPALRLIDEIVELFHTGEEPAAYARISELADHFMKGEIPLETVLPILNRIVDALGRMDRPTVLAILERELPEALRGL